MELRKKNLEPTLEQIVELKKQTEAANIDEGIAMQVSGKGVIDPTVTTMLETMGEESDMPNGLKAMLEETRQANKRMEEAWRSFQIEKKAAEVPPTSLGFVMEGAGSSNKRGNGEISQEEINTDGYEDFNMDEFTECLPTADQILPSDAIFAALPSDDAGPEVWKNWSKRAQVEFQRNEEEKTKIKSGLLSFQKKTQTAGKFGIKKVAKE